MIQRLLRGIPTACAQLSLRPIPNPLRQPQRLFAYTSIKSDKDMSNAFGEAPLAKAVCDFRSDTVTKPTPGMLEAMMSAELADDVYGECPTTTKLEEKVAALCGKEAGLYVPSGTMSNQIAFMVHLNTSGCKFVHQEVLADKRAHVYAYELGGIGRNAHASCNPVIASNGRYLTPEDVEKNLNLELNYHTPVTTVIALENTCYGTVMPLENIEAIRAIAEKHNIITHLDGARVWNACNATGVTLEQYGKNFDSISLCLSKGLGAPVGSVLVGTKDFIYKARQFRKGLGGGMRQVGLLSAAGIYAIDNHWDGMAQDHENARFLEKGLKDMGFLVHPVDTNILVVDGSPLKVNFNQLASGVREDGVVISGSSMNTGRLVTHHQTTREHCELLLKSFKKVIDSL